MKRVLLVLLSASLGIGVISATGLAATRSQARTVKLMIVHVQSGCHTWSTGKMQPPEMNMRLHRGDRLSIGNVDVDAHRLVQSPGRQLFRMSAILTGIPCEGACSCSSRPLRPETRPISFASSWAEQVGVTRR